MANRCEWARTDLMIAYHDAEWGVPLYDDRKIFEFLALEGAQAGLSWDTILRKREAYRRAFDGFNPGSVAQFDAKRIEELVKDSGIVRNRLKIESTINNAQRFLEVQKEFGTFAKYMWAFVDGRPIVNGWRSMGQIPAKTERSDTFSNDLRRRGFKFVGSTIVYAHMQATGMVNDHMVSCFRYDASGG
ncbi:MAG: DNA-3-methyladenine glycosylase I [Chloroflexi bacterium]|nr:DNA-3-methyladenine glycosylase I [Chloroflexota bacterium]